MANKNRFFGCQQGPNTVLAPLMWSAGLGSQQKALTNLKAICETFLKGHDLTVIDLVEYPECAQNDPAHCRSNIDPPFTSACLPNHLAHLSQTERVLSALDLPDVRSTTKA